MHQIQFRTALPGLELDLEKRGRKEERGRRERGKVKRRGMGKGRREGGRVKGSEGDGLEEGGICS